MSYIDLSKKSWQWLALLALAFVWGSSFILMKKGLRSYDYMQVAGLRMFISYLVLIPVFFKTLRKLTTKNAIYLIIVGYVGSLIPAFLFTKAQTEISSSLAGMINSLAPFFALIFGVLLFRSRPGLNQYLGIFLGLIGALGLISDGNILESLSNINGYAMYVVIATMGYGLNANVVKYKLKGLTGVEITSLGFFFAGPVAGLYLMFSDFSEVGQSPTWMMDLFLIAILAVLGTVVSLFIFNNLIQHTSTLFATSVTYIIPFFAIIWGLVDGERITLVHIISISLALFGVWLVNKKKSQ